MIIGRNINFIILFNSIPNKVMSNLATFRVGDYVVFKKRIGKGAFSTIYKGYHKHTKEMVAIKEISLETLNKFEGQLKRETTIMKQMNHPNIVKLWETIIDDKTDSIYLVMEFFDRGDFSKFLNHRPLREKYAIKYLKQISQGIKYLLDRKIIHRDLKPQNILVSATGTLKITDFGFARYFDNDILIQTICGSPMYMAPEIMKNKKYDHKSDLWSIGVIFFEMLTGKPPFKAKNIYELIRVIENDPIEIPTKFTLSKECKKLLFSLLEKDPIKRISWQDFFTHELLQECDPFEEENKLMEISTLETFPTIPIKPISIFDSELALNLPSYSEKKKKQLLNLAKMDEQENNNIVTFNEQSLFHSNKDLSMNFNFHLEDSVSSDEENFYESFENPEDMVVGQIENTSFINIDMENDYFKSSMSIRNDFIRNNLPNSYVYIDIPNQNKKKNINVSKSLIHYLSHSVTFLKESYNYFSNYNSI